MKTALLLALAGLYGCATLGALATGINCNAAGGCGTPAPSTVKLMAFGGEGHRTYLGCLSCGEHEDESVLNRFGSYGSRYSATSILNRFGDFGSPYSNYSACNRFASDPPVVVDGDGRYYGRLTIGRTEPIRDERLMGWLAGICQR